MSKIGQAIGSAAGAGIGMIVQDARAGQQHNRQKELMEIQNKNQRGLNKQGQELQLDTWNKTNYGAQMGHMKDAGLNAGLMYGQSGAGGATTGGQGGGSAASGSAAAPMDIGNSIQAGLMMAQTENIKADTKNKEAGAGNLNAMADKNIKELEVMSADIAKKLQEKITDTERAELIKQQTEVQKAIEGKTIAETDNLESKTEGQDTDNLVNWSTHQEQIAIAQKEAELKENQNNLSEAELDLKRDQLFTREVERAFMKAGTALREEQKDKIWHEIWQGWTKAGFASLDSIIGKFIPKWKTGKDGRPRVAPGRGIPGNGGKQTSFK